MGKKFTIYFLHELTKMFADSQKSLPLMSEESPENEEEETEVPTEN